MIESEWGFSDTRNYYGVVILWGLIRRTLRNWGLRVQGSLPGIAVLRIYLYREIIMKKPKDGGFLGPG